MNGAVWLGGLVQKGHEQGFWLLQKGSEPALMDKDDREESSVGLLGSACAHTPSWLSQTC